MKKIILIPAILASILSVRAQEFITVNPDARTAAMGDASVAVSGDAFSFYNNAAAPLFEYHSVQAQFSTDGDYMLSLGGYVKIGQRHAISVGGRMYREPKISGMEAGWDNYPFIPRDDEGNIISLKTSRPNGKALDIAYGYKVCEHVGISLTARYVHYSNGIGDKSHALDFDIAAYSSIPLSMTEGAAVNIGAKVSNLGFALGGPKYKQPVTAKAGASLFAPITDAHSLLGTAEVGYRAAPQEMKGFIANVGVEYSLMQLLKIRAGYAYDLFHYATMGLGIRIMHIQLDASYYAAGKNCPWRNTFRVGVGVEF